MTPQEQELVKELFDRLAQLENNSRDPSAERLIADGLRDAPHAVYALVQTALVQDEALKRANARIEELQAQIGGEERQRSGLPRQRARHRPRQERAARLGAIGTFASAIFTHNRCALSTAAGIFPADGALSSGSRSGAGHGPGLWFGRIVSRNGRINGSGRNWWRAPAQQHPFDVW
jgi:hypothetical protein